MADYGPLTPSNRLEWFLMNGGSGGSGGGDVSTAKLTITVLSGEPVYVPYIDSEMLCAMGVIDSAGILEVDVLLYQGQALLFYNSDLIASLEGDAERREAGVIIISGDCTIELSSGG